MKLCSICEKRPAKRDCPAVASTICSVCCGRDRMIKLHCPEICAYLDLGRKATAERVVKERSIFFGRHGFPYDERIVTSMRTLTIFEAGIVKVQREDFNALRDQDIAEGIDTAIRTLGTFQSGLIYNHHAETAAAQLVSESILETAEILRRADDQAKPPTETEIIRSLEVFRQILNFHLQRGHDGRDYIRFVSQFFPYPEEKRSLIITS